MSLWGGDLGVMAEVRAAPSGDQSQHRLDGVPGRRDFELFQTHKRSPLGETHSMSLSVRARDCQRLM